MSGGKAKMIILEYLQGYNDIFDPNSSYSGRMLGAISCDKHYIGSDESEVRRRESNDILNFLRKYGIHCNVDIIAPRDTCENYQAMFTEVQSDDDIDRLISSYKCDKYIFTTTSTEKYKSEVVDTIHSFSLSDEDQLIIII